MHKIGGTVELELQERKPAIDAIVLITKHILFLTNYDAVEQYRTHKKNKKEGVQGSPGNAEEII